MKVFNKLFSRIRSTAKTGKGIAISAAVFLTLVAVGFGSLSAYNSNGADAASCATDPNSIIKCGETSRANFIAAVNNSPELQNVYAYNYGVAGYGLTKADYNRFITDAQPGIAYSTNSTYGNNTIVVNGRVVATTAWSTGRVKADQGVNPVTVIIPNAGTYYGNVDTQSFASSTTAIPVDVLFNPTTGAMQFAVMTSVCGNPTIGTPVKPTFSCDTLQANKVSDNVYNFTTSATVGNGATINKLVYDFGDGSAPVTETSPTAATPNHTFTKDSKVTVTVYVNLPGSSTPVAVPIGNCIFQVKFVPPPATFTCDLLTATPGKIDDQGNQTYSFAVKATATNATIKTYNIDFGDKTTAYSAAGNTTTHVYAPGDWSAIATVTVTTASGDQTTAANSGCTSKISVKPPVQPSTLVCTSLSTTPGNVDSTTGNTDYTLNAVASVTNGTITSYVFDFGDGSQPTIVTTGNTSASTPHTFAPGDWAATVTVNGKDASGAAITSTAPSCAKQVTVKTPECKPGVETGSNDCFTYTCNTFTVTKGDNRTVTISAFDATSNNPNAKLSTVVVDWGDNTPVLTGTPNVVGQTHQFATDQGGTIKATAHFTVASQANSDIPASGTNCVQTVSFTSVTPPPTPTTLVDTGAGSVVGLFGISAVVGTLGYRLFASRRLTRQ